MPLDFVLRNARRFDAGTEASPVDIGIEKGLIVVIEPNIVSECMALDAGGCPICC